MEDPVLEVDVVNRLQNHAILTLEHLRALHLAVSALMVELAEYEEPPYKQMRLELNTS